MKLVTPPDGLKVQLPVTVSFWEREAGPPEPQLRERRGSTNEKWALLKVNEVEAIFNVPETWLARFMLLAVICWLDKER